MSLFENIKYYCVQAKEKIQSSVRSLWTSYYVQSFYQGITAPIYSRHAIQKMWRSSPQLREEIENSTELNINYAAQSLLLYFVYYRIIHPRLCGDPEDISSYLLSPLDSALYGMMIIYLLTYQMPYNFLQNFFHTLNIAEIGGYSAPESEIIACECKDKQETLAIGHSIIFYALNRYGTTTVSQYITQKYQNNFAWIASFILESMSFGYPLLEYKLAAVKTCTKHRFETLIRDNKLYCLWFGASFVLVLWLLDYLSRKITNADNNIFFHDALFNVLFNCYSLTSFARQEKFPGGGKPRFDLLGIFKYLLETNPPQQFYQLLKQRYDFVEIAKSKAISSFITMHEDEISIWLSTGKAKAIMLENVQNTTWFTYAEWIFKPIIQIPREIKSYFKNGYLTSKLEIIEKFLNLAKETQSFKNKKEFWPNTTFVTNDADNLKDHHFIVRNPSLNNIQDGWTEITENKSIARNHSGLFKKPRPISEAAKKILEDIGHQKNIQEITKFETSSKLGSERNLKKRL